MKKFYEVRIVNEDRQHFHRAFLKEENAEKEAAEQNARIRKDSDKTIFIVKAHVFADSEN